MRKSTSVISAKERLRFLFVLRFPDPVNPTGLCLALSVHLTGNSRVERKTGVSQMVVFPQT